jgi:integrase
VARGCLEKCPGKPCHSRTLKFSYAQKPKQLPSVFSHDEAKRVIEQLKGIHSIAASLMYGSRLSVSECTRLRLQNIEMKQGFIVVRDAIGAKSRRTLLPTSLKDSLRMQIDYVSAQHSQDLSDGKGSVYLPYALSRKLDVIPFVTVSRPVC